MPHISNVSELDLKELVDIAQTLKGIHGIAKTKIKKEEPDEFNLE